MKINLSPQRRDDTLDLHVAGAVLTINGESFDFSRMVPGDTLPASAISSQWFRDTVDNVGGELEVTVWLPLPVNYSQEQAFPVPLLNVPNGPVLLPQPLPVIETVVEPVPDQVLVDESQTQEPEA